MFKFKLEGLDELQRSLMDLERRAENLSGPVKFADLFPPEFMRRYTDFTNIDDLVAALGRAIDTTEAFEAIPADEWDEIVRTNTRFANWQEMKSRAAEEYAAMRLGLTE